MGRRIANCLLRVLLSRESTSLESLSRESDSGLKTSDSRTPYFISFSNWRMSFIAWSTSLALVPS